MMAHPISALEAGKEVGHYGRLTFAMIARHFLSDEEMVLLLSKVPDRDEEDARELLAQVKGRDYNPPKRERILQWQEEQDFPICPTPDDPSACNVYHELKIPDDVYEDIGDFWEEKVGS